MTPLQHPEIIDPLAAEYVLGTLRGSARRRFERWLESSTLVQERCRFWEENLMGLAKGLRPIQPPAHVWQGIRVRLNLTRPQEPHVKRSGRALAIAASILVVAGLSALLYWRAGQPGKISELATISASSGQQMWQVEVYAKTGRLIVRAGQQVGERPSDHDYELWALPAGGTPVSLGVMPVAGSAERVLTVAQQQALANAAQVAVTVEQIGGSPTGQPPTKPIFVVPLKVVS
jgi:anti-sigma-K factor RskA